MAPQKAVETIWKNLRDQYEMWQPKARSKVEVDPIVDEVKKHCNTCCRYAKSESFISLQWTWCSKANCKW
ncbi:hypothetical protein ES319_1Z037600v1 [Gossypium barbadense]|nr:hypothetical protein ES319_1Z037600v1 [Gossypium barbadense]TYH26582.1 hypothetical protein ES288_A03G263700v1 [Gossypium darwinii]TYH29295.1 hypothetical protein ES288_A02G212800v1 [Gossypium darwinii]TYI41156.1 hypothetical protein ES332_A02G214500v1 [Gossypium tomentosum]